MALTAKEISPHAVRAAANISLMFSTYGNSGCPEKLQEMTAVEIQNALDAQGDDGHKTADTDPRQAPLLACLGEIVAVLCAQPDIPLQHKTDMVEALGKLQKACA